MPSAIRPSPTCVAIDARAPLYDGGICTRIDCVSLGVVREAPRRALLRRRRGLLAQALAIWGRLVAQQPQQIGCSIIDRKAVGRFHAAGFPGREGRQRCPNSRASSA